MFTRTLIFATALTAQQCWEMPSDPVYESRLTDCAPAGDAVVREAELDGTELTLIYEATGCPGTRIDLCFAEGDSSLVAGMPTSHLYTHVYPDNCSDTVYVERVYDVGPATPWGESWDATDYDTWGLTFDDSPYPWTFDAWL